MAEQHLEPVAADRDDAERYEIEAERVDGAPVDPPARQTTWADIVARPEPTRPIVPAALRSADARRALARWAARYGAHTAAYHATRAPKYAAKMAVYAPRGAVRCVGRVLRWAMAEDDGNNWALRQQAANRNDPASWLALDRARERHARWRWAVVVVGLVAALAALIALRVLAPSWVLPVLAVAALPVLAWAGRPADKPIIDRVATRARMVRLTAEMVRGAIVALGVGVREGGELRFPVPIATDGPGWRAVVDLPGAITATRVMERREGLAGALRLPVDQVWPEVGPEHPGQVVIWVGFQPASRMTPPRWALARDGARTSVFDPQPIGTDARGRAITLALIENNVLIGGQPGSGKSYAARTLAMIGALDPTCEMKVAEYKGTADFGDVAPMCSTYVCGVDDDALDAGRDILAWALAECERRGRRIRQARERGDAPLGKITPELAARRDSGLHPVLIIIDEAHELFAARPDAAGMAERVIKRGRALGIMVVLATQIPDRDSLPPAITRCVSVRWCLSVLDQVANDMILGTGAYKRGLTATVYRPKIDAGWGVLISGEHTGPVRSYFAAGDTAAAMVARATALRGGVIAGADAERIAARDMLADARAVLRPGESGLPWAVLAERLAELAPEVYTGITPEMVREGLARYGVGSQDVKVTRDGRRINAKGARASALDAAQQRREIAA